MASLQDTNLSNLPYEEPTGYSPAPDEEAAVRLVESLFTKAKRAREAYDRKWLENYEFFKGKQWKQKRPRYRHSEVLNYVFSEIQNVVVLLTDSRPDIETLPEDPSDTEFSDIITEVITAKWDQKSWSYTVAEAILDASIAGTGLAEVSWKQELDDGIGDLSFETVDPFYFFPDPNARCKVNDEYCDYTITAIPTDVGKVKLKYPDKAQYLSGDVSSGNTAKSDYMEQADEILYRSPSDNRLQTDVQGWEAKKKQDQVLVMTAYLTPRECVEEKIITKDDLTGLDKIAYQEKLKYPNGRKLITANGVLLEDTQNPYESKKFPYARLVDHIMPREFWGIGEVEQLRSPQEIINKLVSYVMDVLILTGNPVWLVDNNSGVEVDNLTNQPGLKIEKNPGTVVERVEGVQLQPYVLQVLSTFIDNIRQSLGSTGDVSQGVAPTPNASGYAIEQLQEAAQTKIRGKARNVEVFLKEVGDLMVDRILQFYTAPRVVRLTNNDGASKYFKFHIAQNADETGNVQKVANIERYTQDPDTGAYAVGMVEQIPLKSRLDVRISVGSTLPFAKAQKSQIAEKLFDKGIIDAEEYLTQLQYPNKEKIIQRMKDMQMAQAQMAPPQPGAPNAAANAAPAPAVA